MPAARGYGRTDAESLQNGARAVAKAAFYVTNAKHYGSTSLHITTPPDSLEEPPSEIDYAEECARVREGAYEKELLPLWRQSPDDQTAAPMMLDAVSTGKLVGRNLAHTLSRHGDKDHKYITLKEKVNATVELAGKKWTEAQAFDLVNYNVWHSMSGHVSMMASSSASTLGAFGHYPSTQKPRMSPQPSRAPNVVGYPPRQTENSEMAIEDELADPGVRGETPARSRVAQEAATVLVAATQATDSTEVAASRSQETQGPGAPESSQSLGGYNFSQADSLDASLVPDRSTELQNPPESPGSVSGARSGASSVVSIDKGSRPVSPAPSPVPVDASDDRVGVKRRRGSVEADGNDAKRRAFVSDAAASTSTPVESAQCRAQFEEAPGAPTRLRTGLKPRPPCPKHGNACPS